MKIFTKFIDVPASNETRQIEVAQLWEVRWESYRGIGSMSDDYPKRHLELEAFPTREAAEEFAASLRLAAKLWRHTALTTITIEKAG